VSVAIAPSWQVAPRTGDRVKQVDELGGGRYLVVYESGAEQGIEVDARGARPFSYRKQDDPRWLARWLNGVIDGPKWTYGGYVGTPTRVFATRRGTLFMHDRTDGKLLASRDLGSDAAAHIVSADASGTTLLVSSVRAAAVVLQELSSGDLSTLRELVVPLRAGEDPRPWGVEAAGAYVHVPAPSLQGVRLVRVTRASLTASGELWIRGTDWSDGLDSVLMWTSAGGRWLALSRPDSAEHVLVVDSASFRIVRTIAADDAAIAFSPDERAMSITTGCACDGVEDHEESFVVLDAPGAELRLRWEHYSRFAMERGFVWAITEDLKTVVRWDFDHFARARSYALTGIVHAGPHAQGAFGPAYENYDGEVYNYPVSVAFDASGELLVAQWDGQSVLLARIREQGATFLLQRRWRDLAYVTLDLSADALLVLAADGTLSGYALSALRSAH
jgi:hypothetical protein